MASNLTENSGSTTKKEAPKPVGGVKTPAPRGDGAFTKLKRYLHEVRVELRKTHWPPKNELIASTKVVIGTVFVIGAFIGVIDWLLTQLTKALGFWN
jgi:preprotein translocase subunit SecE